MKPRPKVLEPASAARRKTNDLGAALVLAPLLGLLGLSVWFMITAWNSTDAVMDIHGWIAVLGVFFSCLVGFGLMGSNVFQQS